MAKTTAQVLRAEKDKKLRSLLWKVAFLLLFVLATVAALSIFVRQDREMQRLTAIQAELKDQLQAVEVEAQDIEDLTNKAGTDEFIERIARDELGLVGPGEVIFTD